MKIYLLIGMAGGLGAMARYLVTSTLTLSLIHISEPTRPY